MTIQLDGGASTNKGAQLMMVAVLQELRMRFPDARLFVNNNNPDEYFIRNLYGDNFQLLRKASFYKLVSKYRLVRLTGLFSRKLSCFLTERHAVKGANVVLNIGGFQFGDQWNHNDSNVANWQDYLMKLHQYGAKAVFLPQAFGPFEKEGSKKMLTVLNQHADLLIARDDISYNYLIAGGVDKGKVLLYPDFTASVKGVETKYSVENKGKVCVIPNGKIIKTGIMDRDSYIAALSKLIEYILLRDQQVVLLNHEGAGDYILCKSIASKFGIPLSVVTGLNAIETKGVISSFYMVISSRFHGIANSLSSSVPCLATSWSHKYQKLLDEYGQTDCLLDLSDLQSSMALVDRMIDENNNSFIRKTLMDKNKGIMAKNKEMWNEIWHRVVV